jgi:acyl-coenzyme A synthetase/AMP-(fatty) acid ligase
MHEKIEKNKCPHEIIFIEKFIETASGKIDRIKTKALI